MAYYINNAEMLAEVVTSKALGQPTASLTSMFIKLVDRLGSRPNFNGYSYLDDMKGEAHVTLFANYRNFDETKSTQAFGYFTRLVWTSFLREIKAQKKQQAIRDELVMAAGGLPSFGSQVEHQMREAE